MPGGVALTENSKPNSRDLFYAKRTLEINESPMRWKFPLQVFRIGDMGIAAMPFEVFCETGLELKCRSPFKSSFTVELANGCYGYLPTPEQRAVGGYETWLGSNRVEIEASDKMVDRLLKMFTRLRRGQ